MGLGLAIARRWTLAMGGELVVETSPAGGARFRLALTRPRAEAPEAPAVASAAGLRVLLAEDEPLSRRVVAGMLRAAGAEVTEVADGEAALAALDAASFDLALLDVRMPGRGGVAVAEALRARTEAPRIALMSATVDQNLASAAARTHALVLAKPFGRSELQRLLTQTALAGEPAATPDRLNRLRRILGRDAPAIFAQVRGQVSALRAEIDAAWLQRDGAAAAFLAHRLAGMAAHFGLDAVSAAAAGLETRAAQHPGAEEAPAHDGDRAGDAGAALGALSAAIDAVDWSRFESAEPAGGSEPVRGK
jgi:CheY-like chemotaxis protein